MEIQLSNGRGIARVSPQDYDALTGYNWSLLVTGRCHYATTSVNGKTIYMHRLIMAAQQGQEVDHISSNGLDNRRENLRFCSSSENKYNTRLRSDNKSGHRGIYWEKQTRKWRAVIRARNTIIRLGRFTDLKDAISAHKEATLTYHGEFAKIATE